jgi:hypothetical protein
MKSQKIFLSQFLFRDYFLDLELKLGIFIHLLAQITLYSKIIFSLVVLNLDTAKRVLALYCFCNLYIIKIDLKLEKL